MDCQWIPGDNSLCKYFLSSLKTTTLNKHLSELMPGLTAKVRILELLFRMPMYLRLLRCSGHTMLPLLYKHNWIISPMVYIGWLPLQATYLPWFFLADDPASSKLLAYNRANRAVAILCNHQVRRFGPVCLKPLLTSIFSCSEQHQRTSPSR